MLAPVQLWGVRLAASASQLQAIEAGLAEDEQLRAQAYAVEHARRAFSLTRAALRCVLAQALQLPAAQLQFTTAARGKPLLLNDAAVSFNVSHSAELALVALAHRGLVGIDLEAVTALDDAPLLVARVFSAREQAVWRRLPAQAQTAAFYRGWTRKEAVAKAHGDGLWAPLANLEVSLAPGLADGHGHLRLSDVGTMALYDLDLGAGLTTPHMAALACTAPTGPPPPLRWLNADALLRPGFATG